MMLLMVLELSSLKLMVLPIKGFDEDLYLEGLHLEMEKEGE